MFIPYGSTGGASSGGVLRVSSEYAAEMGKIIIIASSNCTHVYRATVSNDI